MTRTRNLHEGAICEWHAYSLALSPIYAVRSPYATCNAGRGDPCPTVWTGAVTIEERRYDKVALRDVLHVLPNLLHHAKKLMTNRATHKTVGLPTIVPE